MHSDFRVLAFLSAIRFKRRYSCNGMKNDGDACSFFNQADMLCTYYIEVTVNLTHRKNCYLAQVPAFALLPPTELLPYFLYI